MWPISLSISKRRARACDAGRWLALLAIIACAACGNATPVLKIGLIAPFEGLGRPLGYELLAGARAAVAQSNASNQLGPYRVLLVALNDDLTAEAAAWQARALIADPEVLAAIGPWSQEAAGGAVDLLRDSDLAFLAGAVSSQTLSDVRALCPTAETIANALAAAAINSRATEVIVLGPLRALVELEISRIASESSGAPPIGRVDQINPHALLVHTGSAEQAADDVVYLRSSGWQGELVGGPELTHPWFHQRARAAAAGARALVCQIQRDGSEMAWGATREMAFAGTEIVLDALAEAIRLTGTPSRADVAVRLAQRDAELSLGWAQLNDGKWERLNAE